MKFDKHKGLIISLVVIALLLAAALFSFFSYSTKYKASKAEMHSLLKKLTTLQTRRPYPSAENVELEKENLKKVAVTIAELNVELMKGQVNPKKMEAAEFMPLLERSLTELTDRFKQAEINIPPKFLFSFDRYASKGTLPKDSDMPQLVQQLGIMEQLCGILIESKISRLEELTRFEFETKDASASEQPLTGRQALRSGAAVAQAPDPSQSSDSELYNRPQHFSFSFRARESSVFEVINRFATFPMFCVITYIQFENEKQSVPVIDPNKMAEQRASEEPGQRSVMIGREEIKAKIEVDVYSFPTTFERLERISGNNLEELLAMVKPHEKKIVPVVSEDEEGVAEQAEETQAEGTVVESLQEAVEEGVQEATEENLQEATEQVQDKEDSVQDSETEKSAEVDAAETVSE